jgi:hypothetical protein
MQFFSQTTSDGVIERSFTIGDVPGVLWSPAGSTDPATLVLMGHPGGLHKRAVGMVARAAHLVTAWGFHAVAIDAPGHGDRARSAADAAWVDEMQRARKAGEPLGAIVAEFNASIAERAIPEWQTTLDALQTLPDIDADRLVGYSGMTLATEIGFRLMLADPRIGAAGLGAAFASEGLMEVARVSLRRCSSCCRGMTLRSIGNRESPYGTRSAQRRSRCTSSPDRTSEFPPTRPRTPPDSSPITSWPRRIHRH